MVFITILSLYPAHTSLARILAHPMKESAASLKSRHLAPSLFTDLLPCDSKKEVEK